MRAHCDQAQERIANIRSHIYYNLNCELGPALKSMVDTPWEAALFEPGRLASRLPPPADTAALIKASPIHDMLSGWACLA